MAKGFDPEILSKTFIKAAEDTFSRLSKIAPSEPPTVKTQKVVEYEGRMSVAAMEKFNGPTYISSVSFYLNEQDRDKHRAKGALVLYLEATNAEKILRAFGHPITEDEEEEETLNSCGKLCTSLAEALNQSLAAQGNPQLILSSPISDKNSLHGGVEFSADQTQKQEISFSFWRKKALAVDVTLTSLR